jgi:hypothetical protein
VYTITGRAHFLYSGAHRRSSCGSTYTSAGFSTHSAMELPRAIVLANYRLYKIAEQLMMRKISTTKLCAKWNVPLASAQPLRPFLPR